jgi:hypothetical protein
LQVLADFVGAINENWLCECSAQQVPYNVVEQTIASFASMPQTSSAAALWLVRLDSLIAPYLERVRSGKKQEISIRGEGSLMLNWKYFLESISCKNFGKIRNIIHNISKAKLYLSKYKRKEKTIFHA